MTKLDKTVLIIGATSDIGHATALAYAAAGWTVVLTARDIDAAQRNRDDVATRGGQPVSLLRLDVLDTPVFAGFVDGLETLPDTVVCVAGDLGEQQRAQSDHLHAQKILRTNFEGPALLLGMFAERFVPRSRGAIVAVSSVAGDRGRASNYVYGAAKAGLSAFLSGLRNRLAKSGVRVVTVKPGFVRTRMTASLDLPSVLTAEPGEVGRAIFEAAEGRNGKDVVYVRKVWGPLMFAIRSIPESVFKRLQL